MTGDLDAIRAAWVGVQVDSTEVTIDAGRLVDWARACGETQARFVDPGDPDFQAHPTFSACLTTGRVLPADFPMIGDGRGMDGGKAVVAHRPIRAGDVLTARSEIADIYAKTGRSGTMVFIVQRTTCTNQHGDEVATVDWRMIRPTGDGQ